MPRITRDVGVAAPPFARLQGPHRVPPLGDGSGGMNLDFGPAGARCSTTVTQPQLSIEATPNNSLVNLSRPRDWPTPPAAQRIHIKFKTTSPTENPPNRHNGHPPAPPVGHPADPAREPREPARELFPQVLPVPRAVMAAAVVRGGRRVAPAQDPLRLPQDRRLRAGQDGGGARRRRPARPHHVAVRHADAQAPGHCREADAAEPYVSFSLSPPSPQSLD